MSIITKFNNDNSLLVKYYFAIFDFFSFNYLFIKLISKLYMKKAFYISSIIFLVFLISCGKTETKIISTANVELVEDYPLEGSNTLTGIWKVDLSGIDIEKVKAAKVTSIKIEMIEPQESDILAEAIMQLAASGTDMQRVGILNPVPENSTKMQMSVAEEQENLTALLKQEEITFVADINLEKEPSQGISIKVEIEFELEIKQ
jgi:hypothetical protein